MLLTCEGRMNSSTCTSVLAKVYQPFLAKVFNDNIPDSVIFQHDDAPCHTARISMGGSEEKGMIVRKYTPPSPDFNPIEYLQ